MAGVFSDRSLTLNRIEEARRARLAAGRTVIDLTQGNPTYCGRFFPPEPLQCAARSYLSSRRYDPDPRGLPSARAAVRRYYAGRTSPLELDEDRIFLTASTSESYRLIFSLLADPGDNLLAPDVTYPLFDFFAADKALELRNYRLREERRWEIDEASLEHAIDDRTRGVLLVSPHNPTGSIQRTRLPALEYLDRPLIADEVFAEFVHDGRGCPPLGALYPDLPVFHLNGVSKMFALPDLKLGWIALNGPAHEKFGERLELLNDLFLSASSLGQAMLPAIFEEGRPFGRSMAKEVTANIEYAVSRLSSSPRFSVEPPEGGSFIFPRIGGEVDEEELVLRLIGAGVFVHPGYFYGCRSGVHLMISCLVAHETLCAGLDLLLAAIA